MATIVEFRQPETQRKGSDASSATVKHPRGRSAEIIIFPGVRIERPAGSAVDGAAPKPKKRAKRAVRRKQ
ncbi:hypothetical protein BMS3Bbin10_00409 [bacterium BMS3Bbin10]|nr:hypothetical protein BMS3Bbin10_00409 [bacterium BMS3Bbin10]